MEYNAQIKLNKFEKEYKNAPIKSILKGQKLCYHQKVLFCKAILLIFYFIMEESLIFEHIWWLQL